MAGSHKFSEIHMKFLDSKERERILPKKDIIEFIDSTYSLNGRVVADVGAGTGYFTFPLAEKVKTNGKVIAIDINEKMLSVLKKRATGFQNIEVLLSREDHIPVENESVDLVFCADLLHELDGDATLREIYRILKPDCFFVAVDWEKGKGGMGPSDHTRLTRDNAIELCTGVGFSLVKSFTPGQHHYGLIFRK